MAYIIPVRGFTPKTGRDCFIAENATLVGDVTMGDECSVWFNTVLRGDVNTIKIGNRVNIQDGSVLHTLYQKSTIEIGDDVSIGHNVTIHGAKIHKFVKMVEPEKAREMNQKIAHNYLMYSKWYTEPETDK